MQSQLPVQKVIINGTLSQVPISMCCCHSTAPVARCNQSHTSSLKQYCLTNNIVKPTVTQECCWVVQIYIDVLLHAVWCLYTKHTAHIPLPCRLRDPRPRPSGVVVVLPFPAVGPAFRRIACRQHRRVRSARVLSNMPGIALSLSVNVDADVACI